MIFLSDTTSYSPYSIEVNAIGGVEVCDAFDMIVGTSTGAIIAFLVGLRRESSTQARKRYDRLISRIFVKSALSTPMVRTSSVNYIFIETLVISYQITLIILYIIFTFVGHSFFSRLRHTMKRHSIMLLEKS